MPGYQRSFGMGPQMNYRGPGRYGGGGDGEIDPNSEQFRKLFIGGLSFETNETGLKNYFSKWGEIVDCIVMRESQTKRSRGFGFITFKKKESVDDVQKNRDHKIDDREVETKRAMPRDDPNIINQQTVKKMFVGGLKEDTTKDQIMDAFKEYGEIEEVELITDKATGKTKGFCFVTFDDYDPVDKCVLLRRVQLNGRRVELKKAFGKDGPPQGRNMMMMPMGRGGRGDYNYGPGPGAGYGYGFPQSNYGGGYGPQGGWQGGYNDYGGYGPPQGNPRYGGNGYGGNGYGGNNYSGYNNRR